MLSLWFPQPRDVTIGGRAVLVSQLRLRDLGILESYVAAKLGDPILGLDKSDPSYPDDLRSLYDAVEKGWPPPLGSAEWTMAIDADPHGRAFFLAITVRDQPGVDPDDIAANVTAEEWDAILAAAWAVDAVRKDAVVRAIDEWLGLPPFSPRNRNLDGGTLTLADCVGLLVCGGEEREPFPWADPETVGNLTVSQLRMVMSGGKPNDEEDPLPEDAELMERVNEARAEFWGIGGRMVDVEPEPLVEAAGVQVVAAEHVNGN